METIYFKSKEEFEQNTQYYSGGFEFKLYRYMKDGRELLIKQYYEASQVNIEKIERISTLKTEGLLKPTNFVQIGNDIRTFAMDFKRGFYPLSNQKNYLNNIQKYNLLMSLRKILFSLREENVTYGDLNPSNIITDGEDVYICDSINVEIEGYSFDEISSAMYEYIRRTGSTVGIDFYMLNLLTVYLFNEISYDSVIEEIELRAMQVFNKQDCDLMIGVTDNFDILNKCCDIFLSNKICESLIIDDIDIDKLFDNKYQK